jgi:hypothetical protein
MNSTRISCKSNEWKNILEQNLRAGDEVDVVDFNFEYDAEYCQSLASKYSMTFEITQKYNFGAFRKIQSRS